MFVYNTSPVLDGVYVISHELDTHYVLILLISLLCKQQESSAFSFYHVAVKYLHNLVSPFWSGVGSKRGTGIMVSINFLQSLVTTLRNNISLAFILVLVQWATLQKNWHHKVLGSFPKKRASL